MKSVIRYYGGKGNGIGNKILKYFPENYETMNYLEPFGGSVALLFMKKPSPIEIYNDLEKNVYSLFKVLNDDLLFKQFKHMCDLTYYSKYLLDEYRIDLRGDNLDLVERAYRYFIVNRTAYNGTGGFSSALVVRRNMSKSVSDLLSTIDRLDEIHQRLSKVIIHNVDAIELIEKYDKNNWFFYLDSPYHLDTRTNARYDIDMNNSKQKEYIDTLLRIENAKVIVSGYDCDLYERLVHNGWLKKNLVIKTQSNERKSKEKIETIWFNY